MGEKNCAIAETVGKYPQESYATVVCGIQSDLIFFQRVIKDTGYAFTVVEKLIQEKNLPRLFFVKLKYPIPIVGNLSTMLVKKSVLGLQYPVTSANKKYLSSLRAIIELIGTVIGASTFSTANDLLAFREERRDG